MTIWVRHDLALHRGLLRSRKPVVVIIYIQDAPKGADWILRQYRVNYGTNYRAIIGTFYLMSQFLAPFMARFFCLAGIGPGGWQVWAKRR
jgi:hypothetical protein